MKYLTIIPTGFELRNSTTGILPPNCHEITDDEYKGLESGELEVKVINGEISISQSPPAAPITPAQMWEKIKQKRDQLRFDGGVKVGDNWYLSTQQATSEYNTLLLLSDGIPDTTVLRAGWRTMNGTVINMTPLLVRQILTAGFAQVAEIDDVSQAHKAAMEASATPETYNFSTGWPTVFAG